MKWSEEAWKEAEPVYQRILEQDFIRELMAGTLRRDRFLCYIQQDVLYIVDFGKALAGIASKVDRIDYQSAFLGFANDCVVVERSLHKLYLDSEEIPKQSVQSPTCLLYTSYLLKQLHDAPVEVAMAAVLPCFWVYKEIGSYMLAHQNKDNNPYQSWIDTYSGEGFDQVVQRIIDICDEMAERCTKEQRRAMTDAYVLCTKMEWMFWDAAWKLEEWPV